MKTFSPPAGVYGVLLAAFLIGDAHAQRDRVGTLVGTVVTDTSLRPISGVEVAMPGIGRSTTTDQNGAFQLVGIPQGAHQVVARQIGFARYEAIIAFKEGETVQRRIVLPRVAMLDTARVVGEGYLPVSFLEHRAVGLGRFLTRADLEKYTGQRLDHILAQLPGVGLVHGIGAAAWVLSKRYTVPLRSINTGSPRPNRNAGDDIFIPDDSDRRRGMKPGCYARVYVDRLPLNPRPTAEPVDINSFAPEGLEAIEWFAGPSQTPPEYQKLNATCGVLVLHTRRSP
jgi:hypothetical protein